MMNHNISYYLILLLSISSSSYAEPIDPSGNYWQCSTHDATNNKWTSTNNYQKMALNLAYATCKKNSKVPATCKTSTANCVRFIHGVNVMPMWECTAIDRAALPWKSNLYTNREDAALAAQAHCKQKSPVPLTCSINLITCINQNEI